MLPASVKIPWWKFTQTFSNQLLLTASIGRIMKQILGLEENCKNWWCSKSWKSLNIVLAKILGRLKRCDENGLIVNRMLNKKRIIVIIVWQLCRAYSRWETLKRAIFQSMITSPLSQTVIQGVIVSQEIVDCFISSNLLMYLTWYILRTSVTVLTFLQGDLAPCGVHVYCG